MLVVKVEYTSITTWATSNACKPITQTTLLDEQKYRYGYEDGFDNSKHDDYDVLIVVVGINNTQREAGSRPLEIVYPVPININSSSY